MMRYILFLLITLFSIGIQGRPNAAAHYNDVLNVFKFQSSKELDEWAYFINSDMIDNLHRSRKSSFYKTLKRNHPGFQCKHRFLFHWAYDSAPWNKYLQKSVKKYCKLKAQNAYVSVEDTIKCFKKELIQEQKRRNRKINQRTEQLFGFGHGGRDASYARFFAAMVYDLHLICDYVSGNSDFEGLQNIEGILNSVQKELESFDKNKSKSLVKKIRTINKTIQNPQRKADAVLACLEQDMFEFIKEANDGSIYRRLKAHKFYN